MNREWLLPAKILTGFCVLAVNSFPQTYTISAKPGAVNFIQGDVSINGDPVWQSNLKSTFLNANDVLTVENGKAEVLLNPGVFLRVGDHAQIRMIKPSLIETQLEVVTGESMVEVDDLVPGSSIAVMDHGSATTLTKPGLFRFTEHSIASLDGKADVAFGERKLVLNKNREVPIEEALKASKVDLNEADDLYAWSNTRSLTNAAASYAGSTAAYNAGGYGYSAYGSPGWYWASGFNSYLWLPGNGAFYSPFGWGFYGPGLVSYAPVVYLPGGGYSNGYYQPATGGPVKVPSKTLATTRMTVPVNPKSVGSSLTAASPAALMQARLVNQNYTDFYGLATARGTAPAVMRSGQTFSSMQAASRAASASSREVASRSSGDGAAARLGSARSASSYSSGSASQVAHGSGGGASNSGHGSAK